MKIFESYDGLKTAKERLLMIDEKDAVILHAMLEFAALHDDNKRKKTWKEMLRTWDQQLSAY